MAATAWTLYNNAKGKLGNATINLASNVFYAQLHTSASNASTTAMSLIGSVTGQVANANGYTTGGKTLSATGWTASGDAYKFDGSDVWWSANGGNISAIKYAVVRNSANHVLCWSRLTTAQFSLTATTRLTIQMAAAGIFTLT
jgi:hypothetical protein